MRIGLGPQRKRRVCGLRFSPARQIAGPGVDAAGVRGSQVAEMRPFDFAQGGLSTSRTKTCPFTPTSRPESTRLTDSIGYEGPTEMTVTSGLVTDKELPRYRTLRRFSRPILVYLFTLGVLTCLQDLVRSGRSQRITAQRQETQN